MFRILLPITSGLFILLLSSCGPLDPVESPNPPPYPSEPVQLERPAHSDRPYREGTTSPPAPLLLPEPLPIPATPTVLEPTPGIKPPVATSNIFHTPDDLALPTEDQISDGL